MTSPALHCARTDDTWCSTAFIYVDRMLTAELFEEQQRITSRLEFSSICHERWADLADTLAALPQPVELIGVTGRVAVDDARHASSGMLVLGHGDSEERAREACEQAGQVVHSTVTATVDFAEFRWLQDFTCLERLLNRITGGTGFEMSRRHKSIELDPASSPRAPVGFRRGSTEPGQQSPADPPGGAQNDIQHLFPWIPSDDPWWRLLEVLHAADEEPLLLAHLKGKRQVSTRTLEQSRAQLARCTSLPDPAAFAELSRAVLSRLAILEGPVLAARVFLIGSTTPGPAVVAIAESSIDDATARLDQVGANQLFRGGTVIERAEGARVLEALDGDGIGRYFGPREAVSFLRTPMPAVQDLPGLPMKRERTARITGTSGRDLPLGTNVHLGQRTEIALDMGMRTRHAYIVGQTGTGKSTLLLRGILHDIRAGRGVCVLDPHGTLIQEVLERFPMSRSKDLMLLDLEDAEMPVGFNVLRVDAREASEYRRERDLIIDEIYSFLDHIYDMRLTGGPIFESYFRGLLSLLMGNEPPKDGRYPNLAMLRALFNDKNVRNRLRKRLGDVDPLMGDFIREIELASGDATLRNIAPYVTSKLNRFTFDTALRNIMCQDSVVDFDAVIAQKRVLLCHLARGRVGDYPAGLLGGQVVSRLRRAIMRSHAATPANPFCLYADEFQLFATPRFGELLAEARKFGLAITIAHQFAAQLNREILSAVLGNAGTVVSLRVGAEDADTLAPVMRPVFSARDLISLPNFRACIRSFGKLGYTPFSLELQPAADRSDPGLAAELRRQARHRHGRSREEVEAEFRRSYESFVSDDEPGVDP